MRPIDAHRVENLLQMCGSYHGVIAYDTVISILHDVPTVDVPDTNVGDMISRRAAIDVMATWDWQELYLPIHFKQLLEELPTAQRWIPVTERLPPKYIGEWLCCTDEGNIMVLPYDTPGDGSKECVFYKWDDDGYYYEVFNVTAWMPLPKPYKGGDEPCTT